MTGSRHKASKQWRPTRTVILVASADLASQAGLEQLSIGRLAAGVGLSKSGLYAHFGSKEELQLATIAHAREVFEANVLREHPGGRRGGLGMLLDRWLAFYERRTFPGGCFFIASAVEFPGRRRPVPGALVAAIDMEIEALRAAIVRATLSGELLAETDASQSAYELHAILMNTHALFQIHNDPAIFGRARLAMDRLVG